MRPSRPKKGRRLAGGRALALLAALGVPTLVAMLLLRPAPAPNVAPTLIAQTDPTAPPANSPTTAPATRVGTPASPSAAPFPTPTLEPSTEGHEYLTPDRGRSVGFTDTHLPANAPNILILLSDHQSFQLFNRDLMPEVFYRLVDQGMTFSRAYVNQPQCCPSRSSILTGLYAHDTGVDSNNAVLSRTDLARPTFVAALHDLGYRTMLAGKYLNTESCQPHPGWDRWICGRDDDLNQRDPSMSIDGTPMQERTGSQVDLLADDVLDFLAQQDGSQPWLVYYAPRTPHLPGDPLDTRPSSPFYSSPSYNVVGDPRSRPSYARELLTRTDKRRIREDYRSIARMVPPLDSAIGRMLDVVDDRFPETLVIYLSDNGWLYGEHGLRAKVVPYEEAVRVPLVVRYPAAIPMDQPAASSALVSNVDIAPTIMDLLGVLWQADGLSWLPLFRGQKTNVRDSLLIEQCAAATTSCQDDDNEDLGGFKGIITADYAYIEYLGSDERELYDLAHDPYEMNNLLMPVGDPTAHAEWSARLAALQAPSATPSSTIEIGPGDTTGGQATFEAFSAQLTTRLECRLVGPGRSGQWEPCPTGRITYGGLTTGTYRFEVRATGYSGVQEQRPAARNFLVR